MTWKSLKKRTIFTAAPYVEVSQSTIDIGGGRIIDDFYQVHLRPFAIVVPVMENGKILTITQYKHGAGRSSLTFPAGFVEDGEAPELACRRELLEEAGLESDEWHHLGEFIDNGNQRGCVGNYYIARNCRRIAEPDSGDLEEMQIDELTVAEIDRAYQQGQFALTHQITVWTLARLYGGCDGSGDGSGDGDT
ncbi:MAG: NUDIX hydrolase [Rhizobiaceae bacterium]